MENAARMVQNGVERTEAGEDARAVTRYHVAGDIWAAIEDDIEYQE